MVYYHILKAVGFSSGGTNFDAKLRRQSLDPDDLLYAHIGAMDVCAQGLKAAAAIIEDGELNNFVKSRYEGWNSGGASSILSGQTTLSEIYDNVKNKGINPKPKSGKQEYLENIVNRFL